MWVLFLPNIVSAAPFGPQANYSVCFTPQEDCTQKIVNAINQARNNIAVQAYSFTSHPIGNALAKAQKRGVSVQIILDKVNLERSSALRFFMRQHVPVWIDAKPVIAHNKVIIIDQAQVITGSFNFTRAAQYDNAENVLIINDTVLAKKYLANWQFRQQQAKKW
jgi:phosphatidylserine/phosphatidylglycerophosphate/cardiolipin synthase-like enzyme